MSIKKIPVILVASIPSANLDSDSPVHTLVRACAAYGNERFLVVVDESDLASCTASLSAPQRKRLALKALKAANAYDSELLLLMESSIQATVLVIGGGGREHAIAVKLSESPEVGRVLVAPGNGGTSRIPKVSNLDVNPSDQRAVVDAARSYGASLVVVGPEVPLAEGLADALNQAHIPCFGPTKEAARLESSKAFARDFLQRHNIPSPRYQVFTDLAKAEAYVRDASWRLVVKCDGLAAGKGVLLPETPEETIEALRSCMVESSFGEAGNKVVLEEFLEGEEVSLLAFSDGKTVVGMPGAADHKRALDGDLGLNTGGMGAYAPAPNLTPKIRRTAMEMLQRTVTKMAEEGRPYVGVLYAGLMIDKTDKLPKFLEFNCRFGDPETQVLLPLLASDLLTVFRSCTEGTLTSDTVQWHSGAACTVVKAAEGYPNSGYPKGMEICGLEAANEIDGVSVFHAGTVMDKESSKVTSSGGRVLAVTGVGEDLPAAIAKAYEGAGVVSFPQQHMRTDIGRKALRRPVRIGVLGSTRGTDLQAIIDAVAGGTLSGAEVSVVVSNKKKALILERAERHNIPHHHVGSAGKSREAFDEEVTSVLEDYGVDLVLLIGYMRIVSKGFTDHWRVRCLNVHPSLLPDFAGGMDEDVHEAVLRAGRAETGCTIHFVTEEVDAGPIVVQKRCSVLEGDTAALLKERVQQLEGEAFLEAIALYRDGAIGPATDKKQGKRMTYKDAGVDIDAGNELVERIKPACKSTRRKGCDADLGGFGGLFDLDAAGFGGDGTVLVGATDGVGTKLKVAFAAGVHNHVGVDLVAMCVNDLIVTGAEPLFFLDYFATGKLSIDATATIVEGIAEGCRQSMCGLIGGETAEMPTMYDDGEYDLGGFAVGAVKKPDILPNAKNPVAVADVVFGLSSSGVHSNGFSLVRRVVSTAGLAYSDPAPFDSTQTLADALLTPTRIYVKLLMPLIRAGLIKAMAHITGGGLPENIPRVLGPDVAVEIDLGSWKLPPVFSWLQSETNLEAEELTKTFNCGIGMVLVVSPEHESEVLRLLSEERETPINLGRVAARSTSDAPQVVLSGVLS
eukprot:CAMPEP_0185772532 /NCGR_PEP_ID=MMETSP1174-20130828/69536_1 /TAXON_ID=35687 /ORGANISM="Dictyocha speculum, Strain CCMP1381" /LENGTH=1073 /DNA_ID=CAMNT_0028458865 /DNA_START=324 /DNA_END=3545 /DNA_ORIENTATION=+